MVNTTTPAWFAVKRIAKHGAQAAYARKAEFGDQVILFFGGWDLGHVKTKEEMRAEWKLGVKLSADRSEQLESSMQYNINR